MSISINTEPDLALLGEDLANLKRDVASLIDHVKGGAANAAHNASAQVEQQVKSLRQRAGAEGDRSAKALQFFLHDQPFVALTIAVGIGYLGARVLRR